MIRTPIAIVVVSQDEPFCQWLDEAYHGSEQSVIGGIRCRSIADAVEELGRQSIQVMIVDLAALDSPDELALIEPAELPSDVAVVLASERKDRALTRRAADRLGVQFFHKGEIDHRGLRRIVRDGRQTNASRADARQTKELLQAVIDASPVAIMGLDQEGYITLWNASAVSLFGWTAGEMYGRGPSAITSEAEQLRFSGRARRAESFQEVESVRTRRDGTTVEVAVSGAPLLDASGQPRGAVRVFVDLSEQKRTERELEIRVHQLEALAAFGQHAASLTDLDTVFDEAIELVTDVLRLEHGGLGEFLYEEDEGALVIRASRGLAQAEARPRSAPRRRAADRTVRLGQPLVIEDVRMQQPLSDVPAAAARYGLLSLLSVPIPGLQRPFGNILVGGREPRDFTPYEVTFAQSVANVVSMAVERNRSDDALRHSEEQLRQVQKMEAIGQLAGGVAHDFNNLLTVINGFTEVVLTHMDPSDPRRAQLSEVLKAGNRAASLTGQLLIISRRQVLTFVPVNVNTVLEEMEQLLRRVLTEDIHLVVHQERALWGVMADPGQLGQVILNLTVNARDAMPDGGELSISTANAVIGNHADREGAVLQAGDYVILEISDTGTGMDEATRQRVFEPFFTTKAMGRGTGLGLATVYGIVKQADGEIQVSSAVGKGTRVKVYFPRILAAAEAAPEKPASQSPRGTETVLIAEDEPGVRSLATAVLQSVGYTVLPAETPEAAVRICTEHPGPVHLLLTDVVMPGMSGGEVAERVRAASPTTKIVFMSGHLADVTLRHGILETNALYLQKPFTPNALAAIVRSALDGS
ncbi:MAG: Blue-light-activated protein [Chloroflexi bacterium]|nr:Blue-light-activated protein [Chloroflexota bacterium]